MKTLISVVTAHHRKEWRDVIRETWLPLVPPALADVRFFMGNGNSLLKSDEVLLECDDSYQGLPEKIKSIAKWAVLHDYDFMLKCDDDVVLKPELLLTSGYEKHDFSGKLNRPADSARPYAVTVGFNYWLSKHCMKLISEASLPPVFENGMKDNDDEKWVAGVLYQNGITLYNDTRYGLHSGDLKYDEKPFIYPRRPLRPVKVDAPNSREIFSWSVFLEGNSGETIPIETKILEFRKLFQKLYNKPINSHPLVVVNGDPTRGNE